MSIKELIDLAGLDFSSTDTTTSCLLPTDQPWMLSGRYRRNRIFRQLKESASEDEDLIPIQSKTDLLTKRNASKSKQSLADSVPEVLPSASAVKSKAVPNRLSAEEENEDGKAPESGAIVELEVSEYSPFPLKSNSSYSPSKLSERQLKRLDPVTRAKYEAYQKPKTEILNQVGQSEIRAKSFLKEQRKIRATSEETARKKWGLLHGGHEDEKLKEIGVVLAQKAKDRMHAKVHLIVTARVCICMRQLTNDVFSFW